MEDKGHVSKRLSVTVVIVDVLLILLGVAETLLRDASALRSVYLMNVSMDLIGMLAGLVILICCYIDYQQIGVDQRYFRYLLEATFLGLFADLTCWVVNEEPSLRSVNILINTIFFMVSPIAAFFFWKYVTQFVGKTDPWMEVAEKWIMAELIFLLLFCCINVYGGFLFTVDAGGVYHRGRLYPLYMFMIVVGAALILTLIIVKRKSLSRRQIVVLSIYLATPLPVLLISIFVFGISLNYIMLMVDILVMYCMLNVNQGREKLVVKKELDLARRIQNAMLPTIFPAYPGRKEFELYASMTPTKEVGGDFYDFFMIDDDHLGLVIADVSDKGIPAAMCMMATKIIIASNLKMGKSPEQALYDANNSFCLHNVEDMFVTAWIATLEISTGKLTCVNAGHEYPMIKHGDGGFAIYEDKHGKPIGWMEDSRYEQYEIMLFPGDMVFVYTDGVPEAKGEKNEMFGTKRTIEVLDRVADASCEEMLLGIWNAVKDFVSGAEQFDDLTMLAMRYKGGIKRWML